MANELESSAAPTTEQLDLINKYGATAAIAGEHMGLASEVIHGSVAAVVDFGGSVWNSLPGTDDVTTSDLLSRIDKDALQVYNEHPDVVHAASFIGGMFVPYGLALKGMTMLRAGSSGVNWFTRTGELSRATKVEEAFNKAGNVSEQMDKAKRAVYAATAANALVDSVAGEAALNFTMNAHPYMEDYNKDFASNFAFSTAIGAGLGGAIGIIGQKALLRSSVSGLEETAMKEVTKGTEAVSPTLPHAEQMQILSKNAATRDGKIRRANDPNVPEYTLSPYTIQALKFARDRDLAEISVLGKSMAEGSLKDAEPGILKHVTDRVINDSRFGGTDKVKHFTPSTTDEILGVKPIGGKLIETPSLVRTTTKIVEGVEVKGIETPSTVFIPHANEGKGGFAGLKEAEDFTSLADKYSSITPILVRGNELATGIPRHDILRTLDLIPAHDAEALHAVAVAKMEKFGVEDLNKMDISSTDLPLLKAAIGKISSLSIEEQGRVSLKLSDELLGESMSLPSSALPGLLQNSITSLVRNYNKGGMAIDSIALRTSLPVSTVTKIIAKEGLELGELFKWRNIGDITEALNPLNKSLVVTASKEKTLNASISANLNATKANDISTGLVDYYLNTSISETVRKLGEYFATEDSKTLVKEMIEGLDKVTQSGLKSTFTRSANSAVEEFGIAGTIAVQVGKDNLAFRNQVQEAFVKPIADLFTGIKASESATFELNNALNVHAGIAEFRLFDPDTGKFLIKEKNVETGEITLVPYKVNGKEFAIQDPKIIELFKQLQVSGREMYELNNVKNKALGKPLMPDKGFWIPSFNPRDKQIAYSYDKVNDKITLIHARTTEELNDYVASYRQKLKDSGDTSIEVFVKGKEQQYYNELKGRHDPMYMAVADVAMQHTGASSSAFVKTNSEPMAELVNAYDHYLGRGINDIIDLRMQPVMDRLKLISDVSQRGYAKETLGVLGVLSKKPVDPGSVMKNIILGHPNLVEHQGWSELQQRGQVFTDIGLKAVSDVFAPIVKPAIGLFSKGIAVRNEESWKILNSELEAKGIVNPYQHADDYARYLKEGTGHSEAITPRLIALSNGLSATMLLRFMDIAQPFVNAVSLPILTSAAVNKRLSTAFMDGVLDPNAKFSVHEAMTTGIRLMHHPIEGEKWSKLAEKNDLFKSVVSEANAVMQHVKSVEGGALAKGEELLQSKFVEVLSKPSDYAETLVRKTAFFTGVGMAKKAYPGLSDVGVMTFARNFMDESIGNYSAAQRPAFFQGTFGVAMGLFQTYMLTLGQHMYRQIEQKDWASLGKMMLTQQTIFGASSLPGFHVVSEAIGSHFSDQHIDLETGTFRAIGDSNATMLLYGLPSSFGPGITTRGDIQPRIPNPLAGLNAVPTLELAKQAYVAGDRLVTAAFSTDGNTGRAMLEALSMQSISRPIARLSELATGTALTGRGDVVSKDGEVYTTLGVISRLMATRPIEEIKAREAKNLDHVYGGVDADRRKEIGERIKGMARAGTLGGESTQEIQNEYFRVPNASVVGWNSITNKALAQVNGTGAEAVRTMLHPNTPWQQMVTDLKD